MYVQHEVSAPVISGITRAEDLSVDLSSEEVFTGQPSYTQDALISGPAGLGLVRTTLNIEPGTLGGISMVESLNPTIGTLSGNVLTSVATGIATVAITGPAGPRYYDVPCRVNIGFAGRLFGYLPGTLAQHVHSLMAGYVAGKTPSDVTLQIFTSTGQPNPNRIAQEVDMSWQEVYHGQGQGAGPCSLITPRHALYASHFGVGSLGAYDANLRKDVTSTFRRQDGTLQTVKAIRVQDLGDDLSVAYFDQDVTGCTFAKVATATDLATKCPLLHNLDAASYYSLPAFATLGRESAGLSAGRKMVISSVGRAYLSGQNYRLDLGRQMNPPDILPWFRGAQNNDSGSSVFIPVIEPGNTVPTAVMLTAFHGATQGPDYARRISEINLALNTLAGTPMGTYSIGVANLSAFVSF